VRVAKEMGYIPNRVARALVSGSTRLLGVVMTDIVNPHHAATVQTMEQVARKMGYNVTLCLTNDSVAEQRRMIQLLREIRVDGVILFGAHGTPEKDLQQLSQFNLPAVLLNDMADCPIDIVANDNRAGVYQAVRHLAGLGHRRIAYLSGPADRANRAKQAGYLDGMRDIGFGPDACIMVPGDDLHPQSGYDATRRLMRQAPDVTAVIGRTDGIALGAMSYFAEIGRRVPDEISVVGYDNLQIAAHSNPRLTTVAFSWQTQATRAVQLLKEKIDAWGQGERWERKTILLPPELILRESSGPAFDQQYSPESTKANKERANA